MRFFTKIELKGLGVIFLVLLAIAVPNFAISFQRGRDVDRKTDLGTVVLALASFKEQFGYYPASTNDGKVIACLNPGEKPIYDIFKHVTNFKICEWGGESVVGKLPVDPSSSQGFSYFYKSDGTRYNVYTSLERRDQPEYQPEVAQQNISCGVKICNFTRMY